MNGVRRIGRLAPAYLRTVARREWQLAVLAVIGLAPGVAALLAWLNLAVAVAATTDALDRAPPGNTREAQDDDHRE